MKSGGRSQDFAAALVSAGTKPARRTGGSKRSEGSSIGGQLPVVGNPSPPTGVSVAPFGAPAGAAAPGSAAPTSSPGAVGGRPAAGTPAISGQAAVADPNSGDALPHPPVGAPSAAAAGFALTLGLPGEAPGAAGGDNSASANPALSAGAAVHVDVARKSLSAEAATGDQAPTAAAKGAALARESSGAIPGARPISAAAATAASNAATSGPNGPEGTAASAATVGAGAAVDGAAQASAAAISAAASGVIASSDAEFAGAADSPSSPTIESGTQAAGASPRGMGANSPQGAALAAAVTRPAGAAAATAGMNAQTATALANASSDKHESGGGGNPAVADTFVDSAAAALQLSVNAANAPDPASTPALKVAAGIDTPEFGQGLAERVSWMVDNNLNGAKLQVNPPALGPIEVRIAVQGDHAQVWLTSHSAVTRDALESNSPKLREMLGAQGFGQVSVDISQRSFQERTAQPQPYDWTPSANRSSTEVIRPDSGALARTSSGALDAYA